MMKNVRLFTAAVKHNISSAKKFRVTCRKMEKARKPTAQSLPIVYCKGTHYEIGYCIGHTFAKRINDWFEDPLSTLEICRRFKNDPVGGTLVARYLETAEKHFPEYVQEMRGIADGSGAAYDDVFMQNILSEILYAHEDITDVIEKEVYGCTSVIVNRKSLRLIGHNEDGEGGAEVYNFLAQVTIVDENSTVKERFLTFMYPGMIPGYAFNVTEDFVTTGNSLLPKAHCDSGVPISFVLRKILACKTIEEMVETAKCKPYGCAYGFNINIAPIKETDMWSLEILPGKSGTEVFLHKIPVVSDEADICHYFHQNLYKLTKTEELPRSVESYRRGKRCDELEAPRDENGVKQILGDTENPKVPVYKGVVKPKPHLKTVCTAMFNLTKKEIELYVDNPKNNDAFITMPFPWH